MEKFLNKYKGVAVPILIILVLVVATFGVGNFFLTRINLVNTQISEARTRVNTLTERKNTLEALVGVRENVNIASIALPEANPSVAVIRQFRNLSTKWNTIVDDLSINTFLLEGEETMKTHEITFEVLGEYENVSGFIGNLSRIVPLLNIASVTMDRSTDGLVKATAVVRAYSAPFPTELPPLSETITTLTPIEEETLAAVDSFENLPEEPDQPGDSTVVLPRDDPFSLLED